MEENALHILLADDEPIVQHTLGQYLRRAGYSVTIVRDGQEAIEALDADAFDLAFVDIRMPRLDGLAVLEHVQQTQPQLPIVLISGHGTMECVIEALRKGAADFLTKPVRLGEMDAVIEKCLQVRKMREDNRHLHETIRGIQVLAGLKEKRHTFVGESKSSQALRQLVAQSVEGGCEAILITGETGTGKEVVAREIHLQGSSYSKPFIAVSCPALPDSLAESELFGHQKGAFTGAVEDRAGYFELADGGTLFLDEVADLSPAVQAKLLRVLETRSLRRIGGAKEITVNVRVVAATNMPLQTMISTGRFRSDLFYRLSVFPIHLAPLRERREDIIPLAEHFLVRFQAQRVGREWTLSQAARDALYCYDFPGNARELSNVIERAAILATSGEILPAHLGLPQPAAALPADTAGATDGGGERAAFLQALEEARWNRRKAATMLDMPYSTFRYKLKLMGIDA